MDILVIALIVWLLVIVLLFLIMSKKVINRDREEHFNLLISIPAKSTALAQRPKLELGPTAPFLMYTDAAYNNSKK